MSLSDGYKTEDYQKLIKSERYPDKEALILYYEALSYLKNNPDKAAHIFKKSLKLMDEDKFLKLKTYIKLLDINYNKLFIIHHNIEHQVALTSSLFPEAKRRRDKLWSAHMGRLHGLAALLGDALADGVL